MNVLGIGENEKIEVLSTGAKQSNTPYAFELVPPKPMFALANIFKYGKDKYGKDNWRGISIESHLGHALQHIYGWLAGDRSDIHLSHAITRLAMAIETDKEELKIQTYNKEQE